jgi:hypothetical protein
MGTFWPVLIYLFLGSGIIVRIFGSVRSTSTEKYWRRLRPMWFETHVAVR